ncbi:uncharacterized protein PG998_009995 [Apiospora kogelbergensis]|uniref:Glycine zipper 2TM domain-containing protein n=1 Tax=Apiospora kogelbergensis TaxID=1337665 RepID=A0AAW0R9K7_9PEZI
MTGYVGGYRDHSPDYTYNGGANVPPPPPSDHVYDRRPSSRQPPPPYPPSSATGAWGAPSRDADREHPSLQVPRSERSPRPRSLPPPLGWRSSWSRDGDDEESYYYKDDRDYRRDPRDGGSRQRGDRSRSRSRHHSDDRDRKRDDENSSPLEKARNLLKDTFTDSSTGLGVGVVGALLGGLAAHEAAEATANHGRHHSQDSNDETAAATQRNQALAAIVGAAVGALGANAVEKRLELGRDRERIEQEKRDRRYPRRSSRGDDNDRASLAYMDLKRRSGGGGGGYEVIEKREVIGRPRSGDDYYDRRGGGVESREIVLARPRSKDGFDRRSGASGWDWVDDAAAMESQVSKRESMRGGSRSAVEREIDPEAKSWRNVEDWVYSDGGAHAAEIEKENFYRERERRRRSEEERYRH